MVNLQLQMQLKITIGKTVIMSESNSCLHHQASIGIKALKVSLQTTTTSRRDREKGWGRESCAIIRKRMRGAKHLLSLLLMKLCGLWTLKFPSTYYLNFPAKNNECKKYASSVLAHKFCKIQKTMSACFLRFTCKIQSCFLATQIFPTQFVSLILHFISSH